MSTTRRDFLAATAALAAASALSERAHAAEGDAIRIGFIGVGSRGSVHLNEMKTIKGARIVAICDIAPDHLARAQKVVAAAGQPEPAGFADWKKMLEMKDLDAVVAALPVDLHAACYLDVIAAGKDLYGEKPMCLTVADCDKVVAAQKASKNIVQIGFQRRADPRFIQPMELIHAGELGRLVEGRIMWSNSWGPLYDWFGKRARSGDWMVEQAVHNWDVMNWANQGLPVKAMGMGHFDLYREKQADRDVHDYYSAVVEYGNGVIVNIVHSWVPPKSFDGEYTRLIGTRGGIDFNSGQIGYRPELKLDNKSGFKFDGPINNTRLALEAFVDSVKTRKPPVAGVELGRNAVLTCLLVRDAVYGRKVSTMKEIAGAGVA